MIFIIAKDKNNIKLCIQELVNRKVINKFCLDLKFFIEDY